MVGLGRVLLGIQDGNLASSEVEGFLQSLGYCGKKRKALGLILVWYRWESWVPWLKGF